MVHFPGGAPPLVDRPHHQALPAAHITGRENTGEVGGELAEGRFHVAALVLGYPQLAQHKILRAKETHGQQYQLRRPDLLSTGDLAWDQAAVGARDPFDLDGVDFFDLAIFITYEALALDGEGARVLPVNGHGLFLTVIHL